MFNRLSTEVLSLVPTVSDVASLFSTSDYPPDFTKTLPPLVEVDERLSENSPAGDSIGIPDNLVL